MDVSFNRVSPYAPIYWEVFDAQAIHENGPWHAYMHFMPVVFSMGVKYLCIAVVGRF